MKIEECKVIVIACQADAVEGEGQWCSVWLWASGQHALARSLAPSVLQLFFSRHLCLSVTHAHIHRSFSLTHLNAVSLSRSASCRPSAARGALRCGARVWAHPRWDKLRCFDGSAISALLCPTAGAQAFTLSLFPPPAHLLIWERKYISYISQIHPSEPAGTALIWNTDQQAIIYLMHWQREGGRNKWQNVDMRCRQWAAHIKSLSQLVKTVKNLRTFDVEWIKTQYMC